MKGLFFGLVAASFLLVSCTGGDGPAIKDGTPAVEPMSPEEQAALDARKSALIDQLVGDYKGEIYFSPEVRQLTVEAGGDLESLDAFAAARVVNMELRTDGTCTFSWPQYDETETSEGDWVVTDDLTHVTLKMEGNEAAAELIGLFAYGFEQTYEIRDDNKTLYYEHYQRIERETGTLFTRK